MILRKIWIYLLIVLFQSETGWGIELDQLMNEYKSSYQLKLDQRFIKSFEVIENLQRAQKNQNTQNIQKTLIKGSLNQLNQEMNDWNQENKKINYQELSKYPSFNEVYLLIKKRALVLSPLLNKSGFKTDVEKLKNIEKKLKGMEPIQLIKILLDLDEKWEKGDQKFENIIFAMMAMTRLVFHLKPDESRQSDFLFAKALALLAIVENGTNREFLYEKVLLAKAMTYHTEARDMELGIPLSNRIVSTTEERSDLKKSHNSIVTALSKTLFEYDDLQGFFQKDFKSILESGINRSLFNLIKKSPLSSFVIQSMITSKPQLKWCELIQISSQFEKNKFDNLNNLKKGFFFGQKGLDAYFKGAILTSFKDYALFLSDSLAYKEEFKALIDSIEGNCNQVEELNLLKIWSESLYDIKYGERNIQKIFSNIQSFSSLGPGFRNYFIDLLIENIPSGEPLVFDFLKLISPQFDTRIEDRLFLIKYSLSKLFDLNIAEQLYDSIYSRAKIYPDLDLISYWGFKGQKERLNSLFFDSKFELKHKKKLISEIRKSNKELADQFFKKLSTDFPFDYDLIISYVEFLKEDKKYEEAFVLVENWLKHKNSDRGGLREASMIGLSSELLMKQGKLDEAWSTLQPILSSGQAIGESRILIVGVKILALKKLYFESEKLFESLSKKYATSLNAQVTKAFIYWSKGQSLEAANYLFELNLTSLVWKAHVAPLFAEVFVNASNEETLAAVEALDKRGISFVNLEFLSYEMKLKERPEKAFLIQSSLKPIVSEEGMAQIKIHTGAYKYIEQWKGPKEALLWLQRIIPVGMKNSISQFIFEEKYLELAWDFCPEPEVDKNEVAIWIVRAQVYLQTRNQNQKMKIIKYFKDKNSFSHSIGKFLVDLEGEESFKKRATDISNLSEIAYYIGFKKEMLGLIYEASDWYHLAWLFGSPIKKEFKLALDALQFWESSGFNLKNQFDEKNRFKKHNP